MRLLVELAMVLLNLYWFVVMVNVVLNWLLVFNIINGSNQFVRSVYDFTKALTEPALRRIRRVINPVNGIDLSPLALLLAIWIAQRIIILYLLPATTIYP
jgi:YggT family protein